MNMRTLFACASAGLSLVLLPAAGNAAPPPAAPPASAVADTPAVSVVRQFLAARAAGNYAAAYALLSAQSRQGFPFKQFAAGFPADAGTNRTLPPALLDMANLFTDTHNTQSCTFTVIGPDPANPHAVLVRAVQANTRAILLRLLTVTDPVASVPRLDMNRSLERTSPKEFAQARENARRAVSLYNLKQMALCTIQYMQDHDETMPDAAKWIDEIMPYAKTKAIFYDPSAPAGEKWSYAYNKTLSRQSLAALYDPAHTVMLFESRAGVKNASDTGQSVPVPGRHFGGTDYALADGHAKWYPDGTKLSYRLDGK